MAKRKETNQALDEFAKEFQALCDKHRLMSAVCIGAKAMEAADEKTTISMCMFFAGSFLMHESLCAYGFGYSSGRHVESMDMIKAAGRESYVKVEG